MLAAAEQPPYGNFDSGLPHPACRCESDPLEPAAFPPFPIQIFDESDNEVTAPLEKCPGSIFKLRASGGLDMDYEQGGTRQLYPGHTSDPLYGCQPFACPLVLPHCPQEAVLCYQGVVNVYRPFVWAALGYVVDMEMDEDSPQRSECYFEVDYRLLSQGAAIIAGIIAMKDEAMVEQELSHTNHALAWVDFKAPPQYTLTHAHHYNVSPLPLFSWGETGSQEIRKDQDKHDGGMGLIDARSTFGPENDLSVCVDYTVAPTVPVANETVPAFIDARQEVPDPQDPDGPNIPNLDYNAPAFNAAGYDAYSVNDIIVSSTSTAIGLCYFYGNDIARVFVKSGGPYVLLHEIGHANKINISLDPEVDNHHPFPKNLMYYAANHYYLQLWQSWPMITGIGQWEKTEW